MLHDWVTIYLKYIVIIVVTMVLSFLAMFFIATKNATENIEDVFMEKWYLATYTLNTFSDIDDCMTDDFVEKYPDSRLKCDHQLMDKFIGSELPMPHSFLNDTLEWSGIARMYCFKLNGNAFPEITGEGVYTLNGPLAFDSGQKDYKAFLNQTGFEYDIISGRDYTDEDLISHNKVLVVTENTGFEVGDILSSHGYDFEIIGLLRTHDTNDSDYSLIPFWFADECMQSFEGLRNIEVKQDTYQCIEGYDSFIELNQLTFEKPLTNKQLKSLSEVTGLSENLISLNYEGELQGQLGKYMKTTYLECAVFGVFCITNIILVVWYLCSKMYPVLKIFRVYGAKDKTIISMIITLIMIVSIASLLIGLLICPLIFKLYHFVNTAYEWRLRCVISASVALFAVNLIAAIPTAIITVKKSPISK